MESPKDPNLRSEWLSQTNSLTKFIKIQCGGKTKIRNFNQKCLQMKIIHGAKQVQQHKVQIQNMELKATGDMSDPDFISQVQVICILYLMFLNLE